MEGDNRLNGEAVSRREGLQRYPISAVWADVETVVSLRRFGLCDWRYDPKFVVVAGKLQASLDKAFGEKYASFGPVNQAGLPEKKICESVGLEFSFRLREVFHAQIFAPNTFKELFPTFNPDRCFLKLRQVLVRCSRFVIQLEGFGVKVKIGCDKLG